jgi:hypothetical protein
LVTKAVIGIIGQQRDKRSREREASHFSEQDLQLEVEHGAPLGQTAVSLTLSKTSEKECARDGAQ